MPAVTSGKVLVTGASGYVAIWVVKNLLEQGYSVRGTVRAESKIAHVKETFASFGDKLELVVVEDLTKEGALDEYVKDVDAIEHMAHPFHFRAVDPKEIIEPAVQGTTQVLESAFKHGASVKRVVITSSAGAVLTADDKPRTFSEADWNDAVIAEVNEKGSEASGLAKYRASKTLAEKAAWAFYEQNKAALGFDLVVLNPPFVFGPLLNSTSAPENLNETMGHMFKNMTSPEKMLDKLTLWRTGNCWVDVRDAAAAHTVALVKEEAGGERIIISAGPFQWEDWAVAARSLASGAAPEESESTEVDLINYDTSKASRILGLTYHNKIESIRDMLSDFKAKGWIVKPSTA
ncbi:NAD(P)-binding protein [Amylocystis lapponica]|nr:NAD(P)-binding protein [Amylocystis lapponica]